MLLAALGAGKGHVLRLVIGQGIWVVGAGIAAGLTAATWLTRWLASWLYGVGGTDPLTLSGVALLLAAVALMAYYLPARRAMKVDPMVALRSE